MTGVVYWLVLGHTLRLLRIRGYLRLVWSSPRRKGRSRFVVWIFYPVQIFLQSLIYPSLSEASQKFCEDFQHFIFAENDLLQLSHDSGRLKSSSNSLLEVGVHGLFRSPSRLFTILFSVWWTLPSTFLGGCKHGRYQTHVSERLRNHLWERFQTVSEGIIWVSLSSSW